MDLDLRSFILSVLSNPLLWIYIAGGSGAVSGWYKKSPGLKVTLCCVFPVHVCCVNGVFQSIFGMDDPEPWMLGVIANVVFWGGLAIIGWLLGGSP